MTAEASRSPIAERVRFDRIEAFYRQAPRATQTNLVMAAITFAVMWDRAEPLLLWTWAASLALLHAIRLGIWYRFTRDARRFEHAVAWERRCAGAMLLSGVVWGFGGLAMFPADDPLLQAYWLVLVVGISAGVTTANAFIPLAHDAYVLPLLVPLILRCVSLGGFTHYALALGMTMFLAFSLRQARHQAQLIEDAFALRHEREEASLARSRFFAAANHDLRQPLHALGLLASTLRDHRGIENPAARLTVERMRQSIDALETLFDELLDIAKLDSGAYELRIGAVALDEAFERVRASHAPLAEAKGLRLRVHGAGLVVRSDPVMLERVLGNLVANAIRYTSDGGVVIGARRRAGGIVIEVWDSGIGIAPQDHERIFEEFHQLGNPERDRRKGLGLGLASVRRIASLLGTAVTLASRPGRGTVFRFVQPVADPGLVVASADAGLPVTPAAVASVLIVDDDLDVLDATRDLLRGWGYTVHTAEDTEQALALPRPDLVLSDYRLRNDSNGLDLIERLRGLHGAGLPAALMTADLTDAIADRAQLAGIAVISKPAKPVRLRALLDSVVRPGESVRNKDTATSVPPR